MKHLIYLTIFLVTLATSAQTDYEKGMEKALTLFKTSNLDEAENLLERIANAENDKWLPHYYIAQINSFKSWNVKDAAVLKQQLDKAQAHIDQAMEISENNAELMVLQAMVYTNWVAYDGQTYGMKYAGLISGLYAKASNIAPENPRVVLSKAEWDMGSAEFFGKDTTPFCKDIEKSIELFTNFKPESDLHPQWGMERAKEVANNCN